jgi:glycosyltransferase involved in cell wall biosynthesis
MMTDEDRKVATQLPSKHMMVTPRTTRVLHVDKFLRRKGGAATYMMGLGAAQAANGNTVDYFSMKHPDNFPAAMEDHFPPQVDFDGPKTPFSAIKVAGTMVHSRAARKGMIASLNEFRPDVVHLHNIYHQLSPSILAPVRERHLGLVMTVHDYKPVCPSYRLMANSEPCKACVGSRSKHHAISARCMDGSLVASSMVAIESTIHQVLNSYRHIQRFIAPSKFMHQLLLEGGINPQRIVHIPHFSEVGEGVPPQAEHRDGSVLYVGRVADGKGLETLVRAFSRSNLPVLNIVGDGPQRATVEALAKELAPGRVVFHGSCSKEQVERFQRSASIGVLPAEWYENQPMSILEAFGNGLPMIGADTGGISELIEHEKSGLLFQAKNTDQLLAAMIRASDPLVANRLAERALNHARSSHSLSQHLERLESLYQEVRP